MLGLPPYVYVALLSTPGTPSFPFPLVFSFTPSYLFVFPLWFLFFSVSLSFSVCDHVSKGWIEGGWVEEKEGGREGSESHNTPARVTVSPPAYYNQTPGTWRDAERVKDRERAREPKDRSSFFFLPFFSHPPTFIWTPPPLFNTSNKTVWIWCWDQLT